MVGFFRSPHLVFIIFFISYAAIIKGEVNESFWNKYIPPDYDPSEIPGPLPVTIVSNPRYL